MHKYVVCASMYKYVCMHTCIYVPMHTHTQREVHVDVCMDRC